MNSQIVHSVSFATFCNIRNEAGELLVVRNRGEFNRTGRSVFGPIGGGVTVPGGIFQAVMDSLSDFSPLPERDADELGLVDVRLSLASPAIGQAELERLSKIISDILKLIPEEHLSPRKELFEELVAEEAVVDACDLDEVAVGPSVYVGSYIGDNRKEPGTNRSYTNICSTVALPKEALTKIATHLGSGGVLRFIPPDSVHDGVISGLLTPAVAAIACSAL